MSDKVFFCDNDRCDHHVMVPIDRSRNIDARNDNGPDRRISRQRLQYSDGSSIFLCEICASAVKMVADKKRKVLKRQLDAAQLRANR